MTFFPVEKKQVGFVAVLQFLLVILLLVGKKQTGMADFIRSTVNWNQSESILKTGVFFKLLLHTNMTLTTKCCG